MNCYHPIFADALTIPQAVWESFLTIVGAAIGAIVADRVARRGERRREFLAAIYKFDTLASKILFLVEKERHNLPPLIRNNLAELEKAVFEVRFFLKGDSRTVFDSNWKQYTSIQHGQLQADSVRQSETGNMIQDYTSACKVVSEPLSEMLRIVNVATV
jgi:hypothetical protein